MATPLRTRVRLGRLYADRRTLDEAVRDILTCATLGHGGYVVTPNVDHVCLAEQDDQLRRAYDEALLSLVDGMPLLWLSRALGVPLPEKVSGSDLVLPLCQGAAAMGLPVYLLGGAPGVGEAAARALRMRAPGLRICGIAAPPPGFEREPATVAQLLAGIRAAHARIVLLALGCPKQEHFLHAHRAELGPAIWLGIGAGLDFLAGTQKRAPAWLSRLGAEWLYRLAREPRRLWRRYLVRDRAILGVLWRMRRLPREDRQFPAAQRWSDPTGQERSLAPPS